VGPGHGDGKIVGRHEERELIRAFLEAGRSVVLGGHAGVGKTRLAREVVADAETAGLTAGWVTATQSSRDIPFGALSPLLAGDGPDSPAALTPTSVLAALGVTADTARPLPDVVVVDDGHLLDDASATSLFQLVTAGKATVLLTLTLRTTPPDAVTALWKDGAAARVELQALSRLETDALVCELLGGACNTLTLERVWHTSEGNPLYVRELLDAAKAAGRLSLHRDRWQLDDRGDLSGPLVELVTARIERLAPPVRRVLELVALAAPVPLHVLERVVDLDAVAAAEESGLVEVVDERARSVARATHPMHAEVVRSVLPGARRRLLCRQLADAIETTGLRRQDDVLRFLNWRLAAGERAPVELLVRGAWQATDALDMRLAERLGQAAVAADPHHDAARLAYADAVYRQARHGDALEILAASTAVDDRARTEVIVARGKALWGLGRLDEAEQILLDAAATITDRRCLGWLQGFRATVRAALGFPTEAVALAQPIADDASYGARATLSSLGSLALAFAFSGQSACCVAAVSAGTDPALFLAAESRTLLSWAEPALWTAKWLSGDIREAETLADVYHHAGLDARDTERVAGGSMALGWAALMHGDIVTAISRFEDAVALAPVDDRIGIKTIALIGLGWAHAANHDVDAAAAALDEAETAAATGAKWFEPAATIGRAWVAATVGDEREARNLFEQAADNSKRRGLNPYALFAFHALARLDRAKAVAGPIARLARTIDGPFAPVVVAHTNALADDDPAALDACSERFEQLEMWGLAAESAAAAARSYDMRGAAAEAEAARTRCDTLILRCGGVRPFSVERLQTASPLTGRERQIARLAAQGTATKDIADQLNVSIRTVDSHLAHAYTKLGVNGRRDLAVALGLANHRV